MGLFSFLKRDRAATSSGRDAPAETADDVQRARTQARRRLIGAVVLLGIGVVGFPLLFETQPRPIPVDLPIEIPRKENAPPLRMPPAASATAAAPAKPAPEVITERADDGGRDVAPAASAPPARVAAVPASATAPPKPPADDSARAQALLEGKPAATADAAKGRYIVQVGAFADAGAARDARARVEKLGLKTYTQVVATDGGPRTRVRVGPFASRDEADKAAAKLKSGGLAPAVLTL